MVSLNEVISVAIVSALPISELRGGIPLALYYGFPPLQAYLISVLANALPVPFLLLFLEKIGKIVDRWSLTSRIYRYFIERTERKRDIIDRYGYVGLTIFVSIPLPVTGAWTGSLLAFLLGLKTIKSFSFIFIGILIAGLIVSLASLGILSLF
ncbi:ligand-binding protein SH3 [Archaeoglobales archaeon]|nr:MAG: ligand-binding protein SH3 [Archaeoglobales archaeon]